MSALTQIGVHARQILDLVERAEVEAVLPPAPTDRLTVRVLQEIVEHEAIVREMYLDSVGVPTWGVGVTSRSGHRVERYRDNPQTIERCLEIFVWLLRTSYMPDVLAEFEGHDLTEAQFAAALSFHWNTGGIQQASWCDSWKAGEVDKAKIEFMKWRKPASIIERREKERDLFFDGTWTQDGFASVIPVRKPSYQPDWGRTQQIDIRAELERALT